MKKIVLLSSLLAMVVSAANADWRTLRVNNCDPASMHAVLEQDVRAHRAVITEVVCDSSRVVEDMVYMAPAPVYVAPEPVYVEPAYDLSNIPVVDCAPYPTRAEYCMGGC